MKMDTIDILNSNIAFIFEKFPMRVINIII